MKKTSHFPFALTLLVLALMLNSCSEKEELSANHIGKIVINELMADNRTGLLSGKGRPEDWIEIKNLTTDTIDLKGCSLAIKLNAADTTSQQDKHAKDTLWAFPSVKISGSQCLLVFASKSKDKQDSTELRADIKLPKEGGCVRLLASDGTILSELKYGELMADCSMQRLQDSTYAATYYPTPGFDNTPEGYEQACAYIDSQRHSPLLIWELMSRAPKTSTNWVELKNVSDTAIDLSAYRLAKKVGKDKGWPMPERTLQPGQQISIQLAGKQANKLNPLHATIKLGNDETVVLTKQGKFQDGACAKPTTYGTSIGRANGRKGFFYYPTPSRGTENGTNGRRYIAQMPQFSHKAGIYKAHERLCLHLNASGRIIHYTLDGSEPTAASPVYKDSIVITKSTVVRAFAEGDSTSLRSGIATATYLLGVSHDMAVINISVDNADLYDHNRGIYANGPGYSPEWPHLGANFFKKWTKKAHAEMFDEKSGFSVDCGLKIFGGYSRYEDKKSFCLKFKSEYGCPELSYDFFGNGQSPTLEDLVLRSGSQDYNRCMIRDEFFTTLLRAQSPTLLTQVYRPVALYINANYFGLYYIREKIDKHFAKRQLNVKGDSVNIIMSRGYNEQGSSIPYKQLMQYISTHSMADSACYDYIRQQVDLQGLIDYKLGEIYSGNTDVGNIRYVRSTDSDSDRKWHFVFYDLDASWVGNKPSADYYLSMNGSAAGAGVAVHNVMINRLLQNENFRRLFLQRLSHHLHHTFSEKNANNVFDNIIKQIRPEMKRNCERWPQLSYEKWEKNIADFRNKFATKPKIMLDDLRSLLSITEQEDKKYFGDLGY